MNDPCKQPEHRPQGALRQADGSVEWRVWAPLSKQVRLVLWRQGHREEVEMEPAVDGYFVHRQAGVEEGSRYIYVVGNGLERPDPASRRQPEGVHGPSAVFFPGDFPWTDGSWQGLPRRDLVLYELHVGTFTPEGTFDAIIPRLPELADLGVTALELMPVAQFAGTRNWGYDGVYLYAVQESYGGPRGLQRLVDAAHQAGLAVILDVVYNHLGPEGNYLSQFGHYFTDRYHTPWGAAVNFDGPHSDAVRRFVIDNATMWIRDFHLDGLRLDAVHAIYDFSAYHILAELGENLRAVAREAGRTCHVIAESSLNDVRLIQPLNRGGYGLDGTWNDDFHHSVHALLTGERDGYYEDFGSPAQLAKACNDVFVYDGCYSPFRHRRHGNRVGQAERDRFVVFLQNHDQVGNRALGDRFSTLLPLPAQRLACGLMLVSPFVPMLFMGEEYGEKAPFPFFCSFGDPELIEAVRKGRLEEFASLAFRWEIVPPDPQAEETFESARLMWSWPEGSEAAALRRLYRDLLAARRRWPGLVDRQHTRATIVEVGAKVGQPRSMLVLERGPGASLVACANLSGESSPRPDVDLGDRQVLLTTEDARYGGTRQPGHPFDVLHPYELVIYGPRAWQQ